MKLPRLDFAPLPAHYPGMKALLVVIVVGLCCLTARAEDWTVDGKDYHNVKVTSVDADKVHITFDGGLGSVPLADLPPDLQKRFNYDPQAAKEAQKAEDERLAESDRERAIADQKQAKADAAELQNEAQAKATEAVKKSAQKFPVRIIQVLPDGILCEEEQVEYSTHGSSDRADGFGKTPPATASLEGTGKIVFVKCAASGYTDGQKISVSAYRDGSYSYTDTQNAIRTVESWIAVQ